MACEYSIKQGETTPILKVYPAIGTKPVTTGITTVTITVQAKGTDTNLVNRTASDMVVEDGITKYLVYLTPTETAALEVGVYDWAYEIANPSTIPPFNKFTCHQLSVLSR